MQGKSGHFVEQCPKCHTITRQCKCPAKEKPLHHVLCERCMREMQEIHDCMSKPAPERKE